MTFCQLFVSKVVSQEEAQTMAQNNSLAYTKNVVFLHDRYYAKPCQTTFCPEHELCFSKIWKKWNVQSNRQA